MSLYILQVYALHWVEVPGGGPDSGYSREHRGGGTVMGDGCRWMGQ